MDDPVEGVSNSRSRQAKADARRPATQAASIAVPGSRSSIRRAIRLCGFIWAGPTASPAWVSTMTTVPGGSALASAVIAISFEKPQGWPRNRRAPPPLLSRTMGVLSDMGVSATDGAQGAAPIVGCGLWHDMPASRYHKL